MKKTTVQPRQSLWDMAVEHCGSADATFTMAELNQMASTDATLASGKQLLTPEPINKNVARHYAQRRLVPATQTDAKGGGGGGGEEGGEGGGGCTCRLMVPTTYAALKALRDGGQLVPGMQYRITDYDTTVDPVADTAVSAHHPYDVIVRADDESHLNETAYAAHHAADTYFANSRLEAWELRYRLDNMGWSDPTDGKGTVYHMKDEYGNEAPYDFKNVKFKRFCVLNKKETICKAHNTVAIEFDEEGISFDEYDAIGSFWQLMDFFDSSTYGNLSDTLKKTYYQKLINYASPLETAYLMPELYTRGGDPLLDTLVVNEADYIYAFTFSSNTSSVKKTSAELADEYIASSEDFMRAYSPFASAASGGNETDNSLTGKIRDNVIGEYFRLLPTYYESKTRYDALMNYRRQVFIAHISTLTDLDSMDYEFPSAMDGLQSYDGLMSFYRTQEYIEWENRDYYEERVRAYFADIDAYDDSLPYPEQYIFDGNVFYGNAVGNRLLSQCSANTICGVIIYGNTFGNGFRRNIMICGAGQGNGMTVFGGVSNNIISGYTGNGLILGGVSCKEIGFGSCHQCAGIGSDGSLKTWNPATLFTEIQNLINT